MPDFLTPQFNESPRPEVTRMQYPTIGTHVTRFRFAVLSSVPRLPGLAQLLLYSIPRGRHTMSACDRA